MLLGIKKKKVLPSLRMNHKEVKKSPRARLHVSSREGQAAQISDWL